MPYSASSACSCFAAATRIAAPRLQPAGLADAMPCARLHDPFPMQFQRCADQAVQSRRPRPETRAGRIGQKARDPSGVLNRPNRIPAQCRVTVGQIFRQRLPQRRIVERRDRAAGDDAGIAIGGLAAGLTPVDEHDRHPALSRGIGCRYADDARAEHDDINCFFRHWLSKHLHGRISHHGPPANSRHPARECMEAGGETHRSMARTSLKAPCRSGNLESQSSIFGVSFISTEVHLQ